MLKITKEISEANLVTHSGTFHPDDVFSTMLLSNIIDNPVVIRVNNVDNIDDKKIVYDIGYGKFDHHQVNAKMRNSSIKYSSFGLLWQEYGYKYLERIDCMDKDKLFKAIDEKLVMQIDAIDNGYFPKIEAEYNLTDLDHVVDLFNSSWNEKVDNDEQFLIAVSLAQKIFDRFIIRENSYIEADIIVEKEIDNVKDNILYLDRYVPYKNAIFNSNKLKAKEIKIVILPSNRGGYSIKPMTVAKDSKELVVNFPESYRGLRDEELQKISKVKTARFVHATGFIATADTLNDAYLLAHIALNEK